MAVAAVSAPARLPSAARALIATVTVAGGAILAVRIVEAALGPAAVVWQVVAIAAAVVLADHFRLTVAYGGGQEHFTLTDAVWVASIVLARPGAPTLGAALGVVIWQAAARLPLTKVLFNVGQITLALTAAELVWSLPAHTLAPDQPAAWALAAVAGAALFAVNETTVALIIALVGGDRASDVLLGNLRVSVLQWLGNISIALLAVVAIDAHPVGIVLVVVPLALLYFADREWVAGLVEREQMEDLARTAETIARRADPSARLPVAGREGRLLELTASLNGMLEQLEQSFARHRHVMSDAARALTGPVSSVRTELSRVGAADADAALSRRHAEAHLDQAAQVLAHMEAVAGARRPAAIRPAPTPLEPFLAEVARCAETVLPGRLHRTSVPDGALARIDSRWTQRALLSLLDNAAVHGRGTSPVELSAVRFGGGWRFEVADQGGGIPVGHENAVFEPFYRVSEDRDLPGLGLALVRSVAEAHGGSAGLVNRPGFGVTFWLCIPR